MLHTREILIRTIHTDQDHRVEVVGTPDMPLDVAAGHIRQYGSVPIAMTFTDNDRTHATEDSESVQAAYSAAFDPNDGVKRHAACDECRMLTTMLY